MRTPEKDLCYEFDGFRVEVGERCLWHGDALVPLTAKAFETLLVLVENNGRLVEKEALLNAVWAETYVEEATLAENISTLRKTFSGLEGGTQFIETVPRRGYRFLCEVHRTEDRDDLYIIETRSSTRFLSEKTEIHETDPNTAVSGTTRFLTATRLRLITGLVVTAVVLAAGFVAFRRLRSPAGDRFTAIETRSLVATGDISLMALSPDGKYIALVEAKNDLQSLTVRQTDSSSTVEVVAPSADQYTGLSFSPDGRSLFYTAYPGREPNDEGPRVGVLYRVPVLGGLRTEVARDIDSPAAVSPDGKTLAFIRQVLPERRSLVVMRETDPAGATERILCERPMKERFSPTTIAWSPDGKSIAATIFSGRDPARAVDIVAISKETGEQRVLTQDPWMWVGQIAWVADSSAIVFPAYSGLSPNITDEIWLVAVTDGKSRQITDGVNGVYGVSITADSSTIAAVRSTRVSSLWVHPESDDAGAAVIISKSFGDSSLGALGMDWTPDGKIVYSTAMNGNADIWLVNADGSQAKQLTDDPRADFSPVVSRDGKFVVFISNRSGSNSIWCVGIDGTGLRTIATVRDASSPSLSPDGGWVYFSAFESKARAVVLWRVPVTGGDIVQLTDRACLLPQISPDGKSVICYYPKRSDTGTFGPALRPTVLTADGQQITAQFGELDKLNQAPLHWTADGTRFSFALTSHDVSNIWVQKITGGPPQQTTDYKTDQIFRYRFSPDGGMLAFEKGLRMNEVLLIRDKGKPE